MKRRAAVFAALCAGLPLDGAAKDAGATAALDFFGGSVRSGRAHDRIDREGVPTAQGSGRLSGAGDGGLRIGFWGPGPAAIGGGLDFTAMRLTSPHVRGEVYPLSIFLGARRGWLVRESFPGGRLQPYLLAGVSTVIVRLTVEDQSLSSKFFRGFLPWPGGGDPARAIWAPYLAAGAAWGLAPGWYLFAEWRRLEFSFSSETVDSPLWPTQHGRVRASVRADSVYLGLSRRWSARPGRRPADSTADRAHSTRAGGDSKISDGTS